MRLLNLKQKRMKNKLNFVSQNFYKFSSDDTVRLPILDALRSENWMEKICENRVNTLSLRTANTYLHKDPKYKIFYDWILECLRQVHFDLGVYSQRLDLTQCWSNRTLKGQNLHPHTHPNSFISGIYYLNSCSTPTQFAFESIWYNKWKHLPISLVRQESKLMTYVNVNSNAGDLVIFPSSILHRVDTHNTDEERYTISFNSFPSGQIGNEDELNKVTLDIRG